MKLLRHGDVLLREVARPKKLNEVKHDGSYVVAEGEITGHSHILTPTTKSGLKVFTDAEGNRYLDITGKARIKHQEHKELEVVPGFYRIDMEREFDPFMEEVRNVID